jgi:Heavy metal binding domain
MKNITLSSLLLAFLLTSCGSKNTENKTVETVAVSDTAKTYACSMHPEITGKKGDKCSECSMDLTEVAKATTDSTKMK